MKIFVKIWVDSLGLGDLKGEGIPFDRTVRYTQNSKLYKTLNMKLTEVVETTECVEKFHQA